MPINKGVKRFFNRVGSGLEKGSQQLTNAIAKGAGGVIGTQAGMYIAEAAPALLAFKTGGLVKGKQGKARKAIVHGGEYVLPVGVKPTAYQKKQVARRKAQEKFSYVN